MAEKKMYDKEYKIQAVKLGREIGFGKAARKLGINTDTLYGRNRAVREGRLDIGPGAQTSESAMSLSEELQKLRQETRAQAKEIARLKEENDYGQFKYTFCCFALRNLSTGQSIAFVE